MAQPFFKNSTKLEISDDGSEYYNNKYHSLDLEYTDEKYNIKK